MGHGLVTSLRKSDAQLDARLPMPGWTREGETWRVEPEPYIRVEVGGVCTHRDRLITSPRRYGPECMKPSVVVVGRDETLMLCEQHLHAQRVWIEDGQALSWCLRP